jgi:hypothetical protein
VKWLSLHVGGQRWAVHLVSERSKYLRDEEGNACKGQAWFDECRIYISSQLSDQARDELLVHELLHAVLKVSGASHTISSDKKEEDIVRDVTPLLHRLLIDLGFRFPRGLYE